MSPVYEYHCSNSECISNQDESDSFEISQSIKDDPLTDCEHCKSKGTLKKLISRTSFRFKGGPPTAKNYM